MKGLLILLLGLSAVGIAYGRDLTVTVIGGKVRAKDTFNSDPYMSVTVCTTKKRTPTIHRTTKPEWNWSYKYLNVNDACRVKFHLYDDDTFRDDTIGEFEMPSLGAFMREGSEERTLYFGKHGESQIKIKVKYS